MKFIRALLLPFLALTSLVCAGPSLAQTAISTNNVTINISSFGLNSAAVRSVTVTPKYWAPIGNTIYVNPPQTINVSQQPRLTNGTVTVSNLVCGIPYQIDLSGYRVWSTNFLIPATAGTNTTITLQTAWIGKYVDPATFYYPNPVVTNVTVNISGSSSGLWTSLGGSIYPNGSTGTNGGWISAGGNIYPQ
jgi:hypothetical protein